MNSSDPARGSREDIALRASLRAMELRREQVYAGLDALLAGRERELHQVDLTAFIRAQNRRGSRAEAWSRRHRPELRDLISGNTRAEVELSVQRMVTKTSEILAGLRIAGFVEEEPPAAPSRLVSARAAREQEAAQAGIFTSAEEAAAAAGPWSPEFQAWRRQHIPSSRGLI